MTRLNGIAYAQARIQSRYGDRADAAVWLNLNTFHDLGSYLQTAQQSAIRQLVLGISPTHTTHEIEQAIRQKFRSHVEEVSSWMPVAWRRPVSWFRHITDLPVLQHLAAGKAVLPWMQADADLQPFTSGDPAVRQLAMREAGYKPMLEAWKRGDNMFTGWLEGWRAIIPASYARDAGLLKLQKQLLALVDQLARKQGETTQNDYDAVVDSLSHLFRRHAFQPAAVYAYLAIFAVDLHHLRADLLMRFCFHREWHDSPGQLS